MEVLALRGSLSGLMGLQKLLQPLGVVHRRGPAGRRLAGSVKTGVDGDAVEPGRHGRPSPEGMGGTESGDKGVLHRIRGFLPVPQGAQGHGPEPVAVAPHQLTEGVRIPRDMAVQELLVACVVERGVVQP